MKRSWTALAVALVAIFVVAGCNDYGNTFQNNTGASVVSVSPSTVSAGSGDFTLTVNGSGFLAQTYVTWNGKKLVTTPVEDTNTPPDVLWLTAKVPAALVATAGNATIITQSPFSGAGNNGLSNPVILVIAPAANAVPAITQISPNNLPACGATCTGSFQLTIQGSGFLSSSDPTQQSTVQWNDVTQTSLTVVSVTASQIMATVPNSLLAAAGSAAVTVKNPPAPSSGGGGGTSNGAQFNICSGSAACPPPAPSSASATAAVAEETPAVSSDARFVAYTAVENGHSQVFLHDTCEGAASSCQTRTSLLSVAADGRPANDDSHAPSMSSDGRFVAFSSAATNLVSGAASGRQVFLRDTCQGADSSCVPKTDLISTDSAGALVGAESILPSVSSSGRFIAFVAVTPSHNPSPAVAQSATPTNSGFRQVFVRDTCLGATGCTPKTTRISLQPGDGLPSTKPAGPAIAGNATQVAAAGARSSTLFTHSVPVDDQVFLALTGAPK
jgi:hypothetical protein